MELLERDFGIRENFDLINTTLNLNSIVARSEGLVTSNLDGEVVMMSIDNGKYYGLDAIASQIWELLETPCSIRALV